MTQFRFCTGSKMFKSILLLSFIAFAHYSEQLTVLKPDENVDSLQSELVEQKEKYQIRFFPKELWACSDYYMTFIDPFEDWRKVHPTAYKAMLSEDAQKAPASSAFHRLFQYITKEAKVDLHRPILTKLRPDTNKAVMCFWLNEDGTNTTAPTPSNPLVAVKSTPEMEAFVRKFPGFALSYKDWKTNRTALINDLDEYDKERMMDEVYFAASYNSPLTNENRLNEIWVPKQSE